MSRPVAPVSPTSYQMEDWQQGYTTLRQESAYWLEPTVGQVPPQLRGTLFRNGPGQLDVGGQFYGHPFDGDGMITAFTFRDGRVHFANRFIRTPEYVAEQEAGRILYRGVFGTQKPGGGWRNCFDLRFKNPANTSVIYHGGKLLALWEASHPYVVDPATLDTLGRETFHGALEPGQPFTAHPRRDPETGDLWAFGVRAALNSTLSFYRINADGVMVEKQDHTVPGFCFLHDFVWTPQYRIFFQNPIRFQALPFVLGLRPAGTCLESVPNTPTTIWVYDREGSRITLESPAGFIFHHVNGYEDQGRVIVDSIFYADYPGLEPDSDYRQIDFATVPAGSLRRYTLDLARRTVHEEILVTRSVEFPVINPRHMGRPYRYVYTGATDSATGNAPLQAILKVDLHTGTEQLYSFAPRCFVSEPIFVPAPEAVREDDGWLLVTIFDGERRASSLVILAATTLTEVCRCDLPHHLPYALHGQFTPEVFV
ncbi:MAG: carotenoid oxygenase family protein [Synechococcales cyanobacterium]